MKAREAMLSAVQIYNNPLISFKTESFIVLSLIAWAYLLRTHYRAKGVDYRYFSKSGRRKKYVKNPVGSRLKMSLDVVQGMEEVYVESFFPRCFSTLATLLVRRPLCPFR
jgi:hypothetical protein